MAPVARKRAPGRFAEWEEKPVKDFDPENEASDESGSGSEDLDDDGAGTEHYVSVGKSKLRQKDEVDLGPEYRGARVSRAALEESDEDEGEEDDEEEDDEEEGSDLEGESDEEEFDDPETADLEADFIDDDAEISSDNVFGESDEEFQKNFKFVGSAKAKEPKEMGGRIKKRPTAADFMSSEAGEDEDDEDLMEDSEADSDVRDVAGLFDDIAEETGDDEGEDEEDSDAEEEDSDAEEEDNDAEEEDDTKADLKRVLEQTKSIADTMSEKAKEDAAKGVAIRVQRRAFDSILNLRIRLQKALVASNSFAMVEDSPDVRTEAYQAAEEAAVKLLNTIDNVRHSLLPEGKAKAGMKRKREIGSDTPIEEIWESMEELEKVSVPHRRGVLDKWSRRIRNATASVSTRQLVDNTSQTLLAVLDEQMLSSDHLIKKARTVSQSCAPAQKAKNIPEDKDIYDDAEFYKLLLNSLVNQRSSDTGAPGESVTTVRWAARKEARTRKQVDRKASKGRKLRFTVHEKLQNFMAPEDRRTWEDHAIEVFFGTLFGQKLELKEDDVSDADEEMGGVNVEEQGIKLF